MVDQRKQGRKRNGEGAIAPNILSSGAQSLSHSDADKPDFSVWINLAPSLKERQVHFVILCLLTVLEESYIFPFNFNFTPGAIRTSRPLLHSASRSSNQQDFLLDTRGPSGILDWASTQETPTSQLAQGNRLHFPLAQPLAPAFCHFVPTHGLPTDIQKSASCPPLPLWCFSLLGVTSLSACHFPPVV